MAVINMNLCSSPEIEITVNFTPPLVPTLGSVWQVQDELGNLICATVNANDPGIPSYVEVQEFGSCEECSPQSVNPEYTLCVKDCDGNVVELFFPHPVWTNEYGTAVTQLNAVTLGGVNGLNN